MTTSSRDLDLIVFGATGFTGGLVAEYLAQKATKEAFARAIAGRNRAKLEDLKTRLIGINPACKDLEILIATVDDLESLRQMAARGCVLLSTVGPYVRYGEPVVAACVQAGTHYLDITGEPAFVSAMRDRYGEAAQRAGLRLVSCCGFDSIPHDLGAFYTVNQMPSERPIKLEGFVQASGGFSGGTWQSALGIFGEPKYRSPGSSSAPVESSRRVGRVPAKIRYESALHAWVCPLPTIDPVIVGRSAKALDVYGPDFSYGHYVGIGSLPRLVGTVAGVGAFVGLARFAPTRRLLMKMRSSGDGPDAEKRAKSFFRVTFIGQAGGQRVVTEVSGGDPGYDETAHMAAESGLCLALDRDKLGEHAGLLTPAVAMGVHLQRRLEAGTIRFRTIEPYGAS